MELTHHWYTPEDIAHMLGATAHGESWRAACPVHGGDNRSALHISLSRDRLGNPATLMHCFAHGCPIEDLCAALGIELRQLFSIHPGYARATQHAPRSNSRAIERLPTIERATPDELAAIMLEDFILSDMSFIQECEPARQKLWELAQASPVRRERFTRALEQVGIDSHVFWDTLKAAIGSGSA
jgi:hypothetical protein